MLLTGGSGLLGSMLRRLEPHLIAPSHDEMDVCDREGVLAIFQAHRPDIVIHAAAIVGARPCEAHPSRSLEVNVGGTLNVAIAAGAVAARLVYISTDYVFDGEAGGYREGDLVNPVNTYGLTKAAGEMIARSVQNALVIRTSFCSSNGWKYPKAFIDQFSSRDTVERIAPQILDAALSPLTGVVHIAGDRRSSYDLARSLDAAVEPLSVTAVGLSLPRDVSLDSSRWRDYRAKRTMTGHQEK